MPADVRIEGLFSPARGEKFSAASSPQLPADKTPQSEINAHAKLSRRFVRTT